MTLFHALLPLTLFGIPAVVLWVVFFARRRHVKNNPGPARVEVTAYLTQYWAYRRPQKIEFDYPLPDGQWRRMQKSVLFSPTGNNIQPGTPFKVYVDPARPFDVSLGESNASNGFPIILALLAGMFTCFALISTLYVLGLALS